jgi:CHAT domain-containing protein/Flp pilus assembly protein TadD
MKRAQRIYQMLAVFAATIVISVVSVAANSQQAEQAKPNANNNANQSDVVKLELGKPIEREMKGGELHTYEIALTKDQYLKVVVDQRGIDVVVQVIALDGKQILEVDSPNGDNGPEPVELIAEASGNYRLNVQSLEKIAPVGKYEIKIIALHAATSNDRVSAERAMAPEEAKRLSSAAEQLYKAGKYHEAIPLAERALAIREEVLGKDHPVVAGSLMTLALLYQTKGDFAKAESLYVRVLAIAGKELGVDHPRVADLLNNLALLYLEKGDVAKAEPLLVRALSIREKVLGIDHPDVASSLNHLAELYRRKGDYAKAEPLLVRALAINEKALGADHPDVAMSLNDLASVYDARGDYAKAESLYVRALAIREKALDAEHIYISTSLNNLATLYLVRGDYAKAEPLFVRALTIREKVLGRDHTSVATLLNNLALLYWATGDYSKAIAFQIRCNETDERDLLRNLASGSERQKIAYLNQNSYLTDFTISLHIRSAPADIDIRRAALTRLLRRKGRALDAMTDVIAVFRGRASSEDRALLDQLAETRSQRSNLVNKGAGGDTVEQYSAKLKAFEDREEQLENMISGRSIEFRAQSLPIALEEVQKAIPAGAVLVEFASYSPFNSKEPKREKQFGKRRYVAYLLPSQGESSWVELGEAKPIDDAVAALRKALRNKGRKDVKRLARAVDLRVMQPVRKLLGENHRVFISPDGALNLIPFAALVDEHGEYLVKRYHFTYLTSGRDLLRLQTNIQSKSAPIVMADADFDNSANINNNGDSRKAANNTKGVNARNGSNRASDGRVGPKLGDVEFEPLKRLVASAKEAREVNKTLNQASLLLRSDATESALKQVSGPSILHIATHGFFLEEEVKPGSKTSESTRIAVRRRSQSTQSVKLENPSLRSGLFFAGANTGKSGADDGVLTALEAAGLDLWGTKLVVLSACDTGVGAVLNGEGVQGLRRALVLAGSESQLMSLWPVSDAGTRELMIEYYRRLKAGEGRSEALRRVQLKMLANPKRSHPFYWASFIQSGEWANLAGKRVD